MKKRKMRVIWVLKGKFEETWASHTFTYRNHAVGVRKHLENPKYWRVVKFIEADRKG